MDDYLVSLNYMFMEISHWKDVSYIYLPFNWRNSSNVETYFQLQNVDGIHRTFNWLIRSTNVSNIE